MTTQTFLLKCMENVNFTAVSPLLLIPLSLFCGLTFLLANTYKSAEYLRKLFLSLTWLRVVVVVAAIPFISLCCDLHLLPSVTVHECCSCPSVMRR